jgi:hypothetical protein
MRPMVTNALIAEALSFGDPILVPFTRLDAVMRDVSAIKYMAALAVIAHTDGFGPLAVSVLLIHSKISI